MAGSTTKPATFVLFPVKGANVNIDVTKTPVATQWKYDAPLINCRFDPTGKYVTLSAIGIYHGGWGRLSSGWLEMDTLGMLQQLNAAPPLQELLPGLRG